MTEIGVESTFHSRKQLTAWLCPMRSVLALTLSEAPVIALSIRILKIYSGRLEITRTRCHKDWKSCLKDGSSHYLQMDKIRIQLFDDI